MDGVDEDMLICFAMLLATYSYYSLFKRKERRRKCKVKQNNRKRKTNGFYTCTFLVIKRTDEDQFFKYTRMKVASFNKLLAIIKPRLLKKRLPDTINPEERLAVTLHYLSQGSTMKTVASAYQLGHSTVHQIVYEVCDILWAVLNPTYLNIPSTPDVWQRISKQFHNKWNFPHCVGAIDGKHINIQTAYRTTDKKNIVLMAACDADYNFTFVDVGVYESKNDGVIVRNSAFGQAIDSNKLHLPEPSQLPGSTNMVPYFFIGDESFPLKQYIMRPYPGRKLTETRQIYNYRLSRPRRVIENAFGIMVARWRILTQTICSDVQNMDRIVKAVVCLHNYANKENSEKYCPWGYEDTDIRKGDWRTETKPLDSVGRICATNSFKDVYNVREMLANYLCEEGELLGKYNIVNRGLLPNL